MESLHTEEEKGVGHLPRKQESVKGTLKHNVMQIYVGQNLKLRYATVVTCMVYTEKHSIEVILYVGISHHDMYIMSYSLVIGWLKNCARCWARPASEKQLRL